MRTSGNGSRCGSYDDAMIESLTTFADPHFREVTPVYRVNFWASAPHGAWGLESVVLVGASDVREVLDWIDDRRHGREVELFVEIDGGPAVPDDVPRKYGLIRILGDDPTDGITAQFGTLVPTEDLHRSDEIDNENARSWRHER